MAPTPKSSTPKSKSRQANTFGTCSSCEAIVPTADEMIHKSIVCSELLNQPCLKGCDAQLPVTNLLFEKEHCFVLAGRLACLRTTSEQSVCSGSLPNLRNDLLLIHPETMKLCHFVLEQSVVIRVPNSTASVEAVAVCWPSTSVAPFAVTHICADDPARERQDQPGHIWIFNSSKEIKVAEKMHLSPISTDGKTKRVYTLREFQDFVKSYLVGYRFIPGQTINVRFFGQSISLMIQPDCNEQSAPRHHRRTAFADSNAKAEQKSFHSAEGRDPKEGSSNGCETTTTTGVLTSEIADLTVFDYVEDHSTSNGSTAAVEEMLLPCIYACASATEIQLIASPNSGPSGLLLTAPLEPLVDFSCVGGMDRLKQDLSSFVIKPLKAGRSGSFLLLCSASGMGKTFIGKALKGEIAPCHFYYISPSVAINSPSTEQMLSETFDNAASSCPSLIFLDDIDWLTSKDSVSASLIAGEKGNKRTILALCGLMDRIRSSSIFVVAACSNPEKLEPCLRRRFDLDLEIGAPNAVDRSKILDLLTTVHFSCLQKAKVSALTASLGTQTPGYTCADLAHLCVVAKQVLNFGGECGMAESLEKAFSEALTKVRPSALREVTTEIPLVSWHDIGGQDEIKKKLRQVIDWPLRHAERFHRMGVQPPRGVLLYGPPGCSKTMVAKAVAADSHLNFISVKGPELFSKWVGESERGVRELFRKARQAAPALIFFDEIDALASTRSGSGGSASSTGSSSNVGDRVLAQLLTELDGIESRSGVMVLAATNRPDVIDSALLRPGRFDRLIHVPLPDSRTRKAIFELQFNRIPTEDSHNWLDQVVQKSEGLSGAEIVALCQEAAMVAMEAALLANVELCPVTLQHFEQALTYVRPRTTAEQLRISEEFGSFRF